MMGAGLSRQPATERRLKDIVERLSHLLQADGEAYRTFVEATRRPKTDEQRSMAVSSALHVATEIPLEIAEQSAKAAATNRFKGSMVTVRRRTLIQKDRNLKFRSDAVAKTLGRLHAISH